MSALVPSAQPSFLHFLLLFLPLLCVRASADEPLPTAVQRTLERWQERKFGLMMHWGPYSQWGVVESWSLCSEDEPWCSRNGRNYVEYVAEYERLPRTFNPLRFNPAKWSRAARAAGMRYVVFTTKHHDGFCMFDSPGTSYKITDPGCPFSGDPRADVTREIFGAFRRDDFLIGAYFSKPDWHCPDYWAPEWATPDRNVNYDPAKHPDRWERYKTFTYQQIETLMRDYGPVDILWLDGGWVRPIETITPEMRDWAGMRPYDQDIDMARIAAMARGHQPGLLVVDRTVEGPYENYRTPEQQVPDRPLDYPWETCMTMGNSWSFNPRDSYKSPRQLIHLLVDIVAKGGNFLLNVGPDPTGEWPEVVYERLEEIGAWMRVNSSAIYGTRPVAPYKAGKVCFTAAADGARYAIYLADDREQAPAQLRISGLPVGRDEGITLLGSKERLRWRMEGEAVTVDLPEMVRRNMPCDHAWVFRIAR